MNMMSGERIVYILLRSMIQQKVLMILHILATGESGWDGNTSLDAIAYDLKMNGSKKLAAKIQSIFEGKVSNGFKNHSLKNLI